MKTLQELYKEIIASEELKAAFTEAAKGGKVTEFLKAQGVDATAEEVTAFLKSQTGELSDEELDNAAGGGCNAATGCEAALSVLTVGVGCAFGAIYSAAYDGNYNGQEKADDGRICNAPT